EPLAFDPLDPGGVPSEQLLCQRAEAGLADIVREPLESGHAGLVLDIGGNNVDDRLRVLVLDLVLQGQRFGGDQCALDFADGATNRDRKSTRLNSSHVSISYAVFCL